MKILKRIFVLITMTAVFNSAITFATTEVAPGGVENGGTVGSGAKPALDDLRNVMFVRKSEVMKRIESGEIDKNSVAFIDDAKITAAFKTAPKGIQVADLSNSQRYGLHAIMLMGIANAPSHDSAGITIQMICGVVSLYCWYKAVNSK